MVKQLRIGISGKARTGKDTVASMLRELLCPDVMMYRSYALANPIKEMTKIMFPFADNECLYGPSEKRESLIDPYLYGELTYRQVLLDIGKLGRKYNSNVWLAKLDMDLAVNESKRLYTCNDVRFIDEFGFLKERGFHMIRILRNECRQIDDVSELEQDGIPNGAFDDIIYNNDTVSELRKTVETIANKFAS